MLRGISFALFSMVAAAQSYQPGVGFPMIGIATGESARVNALNMGTSSSTAASSCKVTLQFMDPQGQVLKQATITLGAGKAAFLDLGRDELPGDSARAEIRAVLLYGYSGGAPPSQQVMQQFDCNIVPSVEIYDNDTGRSSIVLTDMKPLPGPAVPAQ